MRSPSTPDNEVNWQLQAQKWWHQGNYEQAAQLYEAAIEAEPQIQSYYWQLGLLRLLQGQEAEAQTTWLVAMAAADTENIEEWSAELAAILEAEAVRQEALAAYSIALVIRQHLREILPTDLTNLLHLVWLSAHLQQLTREELQDLGLIPLLHESPTLAVDSAFIVQVLEQVLKSLSPDPIILEFTQVCLHWINSPVALLEVMLPIAMSLAYEAHQPKLAAELLELYRQLDPHNIDLLGHLSGFYQDANELDQGIEIARLQYELSDQLADKIFASHLLLRGLLSSGSRWEEANMAVAQHHTLLATLADQAPQDLSGLQVSRLLTSTFFLPYFKDDPQEHHRVQNSIMAICQKNAQKQAPDRVAQYRSRYPQKVASHLSDQRLKIGYLSHCMGRHSVGWLARWLIKHHDRSRFQINGYFINERKGDPLFHWYLDQMEQTAVLSFDTATDSGYLADRISEDGVHLLIDLDSLTLDFTCQMLALQPAPVQLTWLGWDASGIPGVNYFIVDPYVLPEGAQEYYSEKLWQLPHTYIAVDGFEVGTPSLRRDQLNIPTDAVIYLSAQKGYKRHPDTVRLQMKVLKEVPNSYFLIKGFADTKEMQLFFEGIAEAEGVSCDRLRFLPETDTEATHRADLQIADVVLDTYPYNGATTTLETLWMGVPLVTRVGEQFAARNSYTMLMNVGVREGIAWTDEEYVEWGIRLGQDESLRQQVHWKLKRSRHTAPLWNAKQFAREVENAYQQMWQQYVMM